MIEEIPASWKELTAEQKRDLRYMGFSYIRQGKYEIARSIFSLLVEVDQSTYDLQTLGALYLQLNQLEQSHHFLERALQKNAKSAITQVNYLKTLYFLGDLENAKKRALSLRKHKRKQIANQAQAILTLLENSASSRREENRRGVLKS